MKRKKNNPEWWFDNILREIYVIKGDVRVVKSKVQMLEKLIWFILTLIGSVLIKVIFF